MNHDTTFFCRYCRVPRPVEGRVIVCAEPLLHRCACCEARKHEQRDQSERAAS